MAVPRRLRSLRRVLQAGPAARRVRGLRGRRLLGSLCRARLRPRLRDVRPRPLPLRARDSLRALLGLPRHLRCVHQRSRYGLASSACRCSASLSPTNSSSRPPATGRSARTSRTSGTTADCTAWSAAGRCGSPTRREESTSTPSTRRSSRSCASSSGPSSASTSSTGSPPASLCSRGSSKSCAACARRSRSSRSRASLRRSPPSRSRCGPRSRSGTG